MLLTAKDDTQPSLMLDGGIGRVYCQSCQRDCGLESAPRARLSLMTVKFIVAKGENTQRLDLRRLRSITGSIDKLAFELRRS